MRARRTALTVAVGATLLVTVPVGSSAFAGRAVPAHSASGRSAAVATAKKKPVTVASSLKTLVTQTSALPKTAVPAVKRTQLLARATHARSVAAKQPCAAVTDLTALRKVLRSTTVNRKLKAKAANATRARLGAIGTTSLKASTLLLTGKGTTACGGRHSDAATVSDPTTSVKTSTPQALAVHIALPAPTLTTVSEGGKTWTQISVPDGHTAGAPGTPGIPVVDRSFAIPDGATVALHATSTTAYTLTGVDLYPVQREPADGDPFATGPFVRHGFSVNAAAYRKKGFTAGATSSSVGRFRDVQIGSLQVPAAQYDAPTHTVKVLTGVDATLVFSGGAATFSPTISSPWEKPERDVLGSLMNGSLANQKQKFPFFQCGEEMLVISEPSLHTVAQQFVDAKNVQGMRTTLVEVKTSAGGTIGDDVASIQSYIRGELNAKSCIHPSYVTILGDQTLVPTDQTYDLTDVDPASPENDIESDLPYALADSTDELPDVALGRIPGGNAAEVGQSISKILGYENHPPTDPAFLTHATVAAYFQDDSDKGGTDDGREERTFIQLSEQVRDALIKRGDTVDRVYTRDGAKSTPATFNDGSALPADLLKPGAWSGLGADIAADWNAGRFLVLHRDHGSSSGFAHPGFYTPNVNALTNTNSQLPVLMSVNCASAKYAGGESFVERAVNKAVGGAVGAFGDTDNSPSYENSQLALGFADSLLPSVLPGEGSDTHLRMGEALTAAKLRLASEEPPNPPSAAFTNASRDELYLWHYFGDPSMQMWGGGNDPVTYNINRFTADFTPVIQQPGPDPDPFYAVNVTAPSELAGQQIALLNKGAVVGKGIADAAGHAVVDATFGSSAVANGDLTVAVAADGAAPVTVPVSGVPTTKTTLTQDCSGSTTASESFPITTKGTLTGAPVGSDVAVTYSYDTTHEQHVVHTTTTAGGAWTAQYTTSFGQIGTWHTIARYAGTTQLAPSQSAGCTTDVTSYKP